MAVLITDAEKNEVRARFPGLDFQQDGEIVAITGNLDTTADYKLGLIEDSFFIRIELPVEYPDKIPIVRETGGRIKKFAELNGISDTRDLHCYSRDNSICLCIGAEERKRFTPTLGLCRFIEELVVPYFYAFSFFEKNRYWPWGDYSHGLMGYFEYYLDVRDIPSRETVGDFLEIVKKAGKNGEWEVYRNYLKRRGGIKGHVECLSCKNLSKFRKCHPNALAGMRTFRQDTNQLGVQI